MLVANPPDCAGGEVRTLSGFGVGGAGVAAEIVGVLIERPRGDGEHRRPRRERMLRRVSRDRRGQPPFGLAQELLALERGAACTRERRMLQTQDARPAWVVL